MEKLPTTTRSNELPECLDPGTYAAVESGYKNSLRSQSAYDAKRKIGKAIQYVCATHGADPPSDPVLYECIGIMMSRFSHMSDLEIREAFKLYALNEFEVRGGEIWKSKFTVKVFARVMSGYEVHRRQYAKLIRVKYEDAQVKRYLEARAKHKRSEYNRNFGSMLLDIKKKNDYLKIPSYLFHEMSQRGIIKLDPAEAANLLAEATEIASKKISAEYDTETRLDVKRALGDNIESSVKSRAKVIARQLAVFNYLVDAIESELLSFNHDPDMDQ